MDTNISNICRICLCDGSRNIFERKSTECATQFGTPFAQNVSSLDRLLEKLRYVTMMKVNTLTHPKRFVGMRSTYYILYELIDAIFECSFVMEMFCSVSRTDVRLYIIYVCINWLSVRMCIDIVLHARGGWLWIIQCCTAHVGMCI